jgi:hypothetical protein
VLRFAAPMFFAAWALAAAAAGAATPPPLALESMTSPELAARIAAGATIAIVPIGGTEQNGP